MIRRFITESNIYTVAVYAGQNDILTVSRDGKNRTVKVLDSIDYRYKLKKNCIEARDGANGIYKFISDCFDENFNRVSALKILNHIIDSMIDTKEWKDVRRFYIYRNRGHH